MTEEKALDSKKPVASLGRRRLLVGVSTLFASLVGARFLQKDRRASERPTLAPDLRDCGNFRHIFGDPELRGEFRKFLTNVFHLYPEDEFDRLIAECVEQDPRDPAVYGNLARRLPEITPLLASLRYALPALAHQKREMAAQTTKLLAGRRRFEGYLEIGSHGRYFDALSGELELVGPRFTTALKGDDFGPEAIVDRGSLGRAGAVLPWTDYEPIPSTVGSGSVELVTVYIGLHHAPVEKRRGYMDSLRRVLAPSGSLILRDHDVKTKDLEHLVGLAHDVFNVGTSETIETNDSERRNFYSLEALIAMMVEAGFSLEPGRLLQAGDPTQNTLLHFKKA